MAVAVAVDKLSLNLLGFWGAGLQLHLHRHHLLGPLKIPNSGAGSFGWEACDWSGRSPPLSVWRSLAKPHFNNVLGPKGHLRSLLFWICDIFSPSRQP